MYDGGHSLERCTVRYEERPEQLPLWGVNHRMTVGLSFFDLNDGFALIGPAIQTGIMRKL